MQVGSLFTLPQGPFSPCHFQARIIAEQEREGVDRVLNAVALTYVAAAVSTLLTLLYFLWRAGLPGGRR